MREEMWMRTRERERETDERESEHLRFSLTLFFAEYCADDSLWHIHSSVAHLRFPVLWTVTSEITSTTTRLIMMFKAYIT